MVIYLVWDTYDYYNEQLVEICSTHELAEQVMASHARLSIQYKRQYAGFDEAKASAEYARSWLHIDEREPIIELSGD
jgi:hypothetical protein